MSARGARSRKIQQKEVEKKEKKVGKTKAVESSDGFADWRATPSVNTPKNGIGVTRSHTVSSRATSRSSGTNESNSRPRLETVYSTGSSKPQLSSAGGSASVSDVSTQGTFDSR
jgi:hypothetical protein